MVSSHLGSDSSWTYSTLEISEKHFIRYGIFSCENSAINNAVVFLNGRSEWIEKYRTIPELINLDPGTIFLTLDHQGQGASSGRRAHIDDYETYVKDVSLVIEAIIPSLSYTIIAHSMGGLIGLYGTILGHLNPKLLILCSPLLRLPNPVIGPKIAKRIFKTLEEVDLSTFHTGLGARNRNKFAGNPLTHSYSGFQAIRNTPYPIPTPTIGWINATIKTCEEIRDQKLLTSFKKPTLVIGGSKEEVVDIRGFSEWTNLAIRSGNPEVSYEIVHGAKHELLNEISSIRLEVAAKINSWLKKYG